MISTKRLIAILTIIFLMLTYTCNISGHPNFYSRYIKMPSDKLLQIGNGYISKSDKADSALVCFSIVANRYSDNMDRHDKEMTMNGYIGRWYVYFFKFFNYEKSYESLLKAKHIAEDINCGLAHIDLNFGCMFQTLAEQCKDKPLKEKALNYYKKAFYESLKENDNNSLNMAFSNMVFVSFNLNKLHTIRNMQKHYAAKKQNGNDFIRTYNINMYKGLNYLNSKEYDKALNIFEKQKQSTSHTAENMRYVYIAHINIARTLAATNKYEQAICELKDAGNIAFKYDMKDAILDIYNLQAQYYLRSGNTKLSDIYRNKYYQLKDTLLNYNQVAKVSQMQFLDQINEMDKRMAEIIQKHKQEELLTRIGFIVTTIIMVLAIMLYIKNKNLKRSNEHLYNNTLESLQREEIERNMRINYEKMLEEKENNENNAADAKSRYKTSGLSEEDKGILLNKIINIMQTSEEIYSPDFKADRLVELVGSNNRYVSQVINEKINCNFTTLLGEYRVKEICKRMNKVDEYGNLTINAIASSVGFRSHSGFFSMFKRVTGLSPAQYQKLARENYHKK